MEQQTELVATRHGEHTTRHRQGADLAAGTAYCALSYGIGVTTDRKAGRVTPELAEERRRFRLAIGAMVRSLRLGQGDPPGKKMSQTVLAKRVGVSRWTISQMELGNSAISSDVLFTIFRVLGGLPSITREIFGPV